MSLQTLYARCKPIYSVLTLALLLSFTACNRGQQAHAPTPKTITAADLQKLRWIEGSWRGAGVDQPPFFERYRFENETTLAVDHFADEALTKVTETSRYELKNGEFRNAGGGPGHVATALDDNSITFEPSSAGSNSFTWKRVSKDSWTAVLAWPASGNRPAGERTYNLERWPKQ
ncbi:MAG TPA: hypothetical protein VJT15_10070 [Pyrinomonadaceae bacterium]|nr:hypothetical protein [Pyrinomonadaceae bacterium]